MKLKKVKNKNQETEKWDRKSTKEGNNDQLKEDKKLEKKP